MARSQKSFALFPSEPLAAPPPRVAPRPRRELWLAVHLPRLPLDAIAARSRGAAQGFVAAAQSSAAAQGSVTAALGAVAVVEPQGGHLRVVAVSRAAAVHGVRRGLKLPAALALLGSLTTLERSPSAEHASLESLATFAHGLSSTVSVMPPADVVLEIGGSLKLFGTLAAVKERLGVELRRRGWAYRLRVAPTALAAVWLARARHGEVLAPAALASGLGALPLGVTGWSPPVLKLLHELGVRTIGECLRLPRGGLARRVGQEPLADLDRALGRQIDLRRAHEPPRRLRLRAELEQECADRSVLAAVATELLAQLGADLEQRQSQVQSFTLVLEHRRETATVERFELIAADHRHERFASLTAERLERLVLRAPVAAVRIVSGPYRALALEWPDLFAAGRRRGKEIELLERLRERFGAAAVFGVGLVADHRPEHAWNERVDLTSSAAGMRTAPQSNRPDERAALQPDRAEHASLEPPAASWVQRRPLWMLPEPLPLDSAAARAYCGGGVRIHSGPERIESGWWDERDVRRDYYAAEGESGRELWVFRDRLSRAWHLHGLFG